MTQEQEQQLSQTMLAMMQSGATHRKARWRFRCTRGG